MAKFVAHTENQEIGNLTFEWNISKLADQMKTVKNGEFLLLDNVSVEETKWSFKVYPNGVTSASKEAISVCCYSENETSKIAQVSFSIFKTSDNSGKTPKKQIRKVYKKKEFIHSYKAKTELGIPEGWGYAKFLTHEEVKNPANFLLNGNLLLLIKITVLGEPKTNKHPSDPTLYDFEDIEKQMKFKVIERFKDSWVNNDFSDVNIMCKGEIFYCHRMVLARSSQYFRGMLESGMQESLTQVINLDHMDVDILRAILKFIYGGEMDNLEVTAVPLLKASNMLIIEDLRFICEKYLLAKYIKLDNVLDVLVMSETHNANDLKKGAMEMIVEKSGAIVKQVGWKEKLADKPNLVLEVFEAIASTNDD